MREHDVEVGEVFVFCAVSILLFGPIGIALRIFGLVSPEEKQITFTYWFVFSMFLFFVAIIAIIKRVRFSGLSVIGSAIAAFLVGITAVFENRFFLVNWPSFFMLSYVLSIYFDDRNRRNRKQTSRTG